MNVAAVKEGGPASALGRVDLSELKELPIRKALAPILTAGVLYYGLEMYKEEELNKVEQVNAKLTSEKRDLEKKLEKFKDNDNLKKQLESDEAALKNKLEVIKKLSTDRSAGEKLIISIANSIPENVWLNEFKYEKGELQFRGAANELNLVSDFMKNLNENLLMKEVELKETQKKKEFDRGPETTSYEIYAKRRAN